MGLVKRFLQRWQKDGLFLAIHLVIDYSLGINLINVYNALIFREHKIITSCDIETVLPRSTTLPHPVGIVIGHDVDVGEDVRIQQNVTLGRTKPEPEEGYPIIREGARIGAGAVVVGDVELAEGCVVGGNAVVLDDVNSNTTVVGAPATEVDA